MRSVRSAAVVVSLLLGGCSETITDVFFEADAMLSMRAAFIEASITDARGAQRFENRIAVDTFPVALRIRPAGDDATRTFTVAGRLFDDADMQLAEVRARGSFTEGECTRLTLRFDDACVGVACGASETCADGACVPLGGADGGVADAGPPTDVGPPVDAEDPDAAATEPPFLDAFLEMFTTTSSRPVDVLSSGEPFGLDLPTAEPAWLVLVSARTSSTNMFRGALSLTMLVNGTVRAEAGTWSEVPGRGSSFMTFDVVSGGDSIRFRLESRDPSVAAVEDLHVVALPLPGGLALMEERGPLVLADGAAYRTDHSRACAPCDDVLLLAGLQNERDRAGATAEARLATPALPAEHWPVASSAQRPHFASWRPDPVWHFLARRVAPTDPEGTFAWQTRGTQPDASRAAFYRILPVPLDSVRWSGSEMPLAQAVDGVPSPILTHDVPPFRRGSVVVMSTIVSHQTARMGLSRRNVTLSLGAATDRRHRRTHDEIAHVEHRVNYGAVFTLAPGEAGLAEIQAWSEDGDALEAKESVIHVLGFD